MKTPKPEMAIKQIGIGSILKNFNLRVPPHQREYSWTEKQVEKLYDDLDRAIDDQPEYFLGAIAAFQESSGVLRVIDGQQRLATTTILLRAMQLYVKPLNSFIAEKYISQYLVYADADQMADLPRLRLNSNDNEFFSKTISAQSKSERPEPTQFSHRLILKAFEMAEERVKKIVSGHKVTNHPDRLKKWVEYIAENADVILLQMPVGYNAYKIFETLNNRGLETTQSDMVKSYIFEQAETNDRISEAQTWWSKLKGALDSLQDDKDISVVFIRYALILIQGPLTKDQILDVVQSRVKGAGAAVSFCQQLERLAVTYAATCYSDHEKWSAYPDGIKLAIQTLNFFNIQPFRPTMMAIAEAFDANEAVKAYETLISLGVRIMISSSTSSGSVEGTLNPVAHQIFKREIRTAKALRQAIEPIFPNDDTFRARFATATVSKSPLAKYYLRALERVVKKEPTPWYNINDDKDVINLEHILPEEPADNWPQFSPQESEANWRRLGNMALHSKKINSDLRSSSFSVKRPTFKVCPYKLTSQLAKVKDWNVKMINIRQKKMADFAVEAWPY